jgi:hypothetical protein
VHCEDVPQVFLRDATVLRSTGGLFSVALSVALRVAQALACAPPLRPLTLSGALPCQEFRSPQSEERASGRCPDFPPAPALWRRPLGRHSSAGTSDHPARPPLPLYRESVSVDREQWPCAILKLLHPEQLLELRFTENRHAQFLRLLILRSRIRPHHYVIRLLAHRPRNFSAVLLHDLTGFFP